MFLRHISEEQLNAPPERVAELLEKSILRAPKKKEDRTRAAIITTRREALSLYRSVWRWSNLFVWKDAQGRVWRDVIRQSARKEFEDARFEQDPEIVNRLLVTGREAVQKSVDKFMQKREQIIKEEEDSR